MLKYERVEVYLHFCIHSNDVMLRYVDSLLNLLCLGPFPLSNVNYLIGKTVSFSGSGFSLRPMSMFLLEVGWLEQFRRKVNWGDGGENVKEKEDREWTNALLKRWKLFLQIKVLMRENRSLHWGGYVTVGGGCVDKWGAKCGLDAVFERDMSIWPMHPENDEVLLLIWS